jgi:hypothetical protein
MLAMLADLLPAFSRSSLPLCATNAQYLHHLAAWESNQVALTHFPWADIYPALIFKPILADGKKTARRPRFRGQT